MRIDSVGNVGIGTPAPTEKLHVLGNIKATGSVFASCGTLSCSDVRFKKQVEPIDGALAKVSHLRGVNFDWKREEFPEQQFSDQRQVGFIAQEVKKVVPEVVQEGSDGRLSVDYGRLTPILVEAVKELSERVGQRDRKIARQQSKIDQLTARLERLEKSVAIQSTDKSH